METSRKPHARRHGRRTTSDGRRADAVKVLLVEDSRTYAAIVRKTMVRPGNGRYRFAHVGRLDEALRMLHHDRTDVVLLDLTLPDSDGLRTIERVHQRAPGVPIVVLTGTADASLALKAIHAGAQDYLVKDRMDRDLLERAIRYAIERHRLQVELQQQQQQQQQQEQRERELTALERLAGAAKTRSTGTEPLTGRYTEVLRGYLTSGAMSPAVVAKATAKALYEQGLSGADVINLHLAATDALTQALTPEMASQLIERARFLVLGVLANLVDRYRAGTGVKER